MHVSDSITEKRQKDESAKEINKKLKDKQEEKQKNNCLEESAKRKVTSSNPGVEIISILFTIKKERER